MKIGFLDNELPPGHRQVLQIALRRAVAIRLEKANAKLTTGRNALHMEVRSDGSRWLVMAVELVPSGRRRSES